LNRKLRNYITGDTHGNDNHDLEKLSHSNWSVGRYLDKEDTVIIVGDFGLIFHPEQTKKEKYWLDWLEYRPWTTLFIDGNHDNFPKLDALPRVEMFGGTVGKVSNSIFHLRRGEIYVINGQKIFTFGGASSTDKEQRIVGIDWWPEEEAGYAEHNHALDNLEKHGNEVDIVITHTMPSEHIPVLNKMVDYNYSRRMDTTARFLQEVYNNIKFKAWFCGHFHDDLLVKDVHLLYNNIYTFSGGKIHTMVPKNADKKAALRGL